MTEPSALKRDVISTDLSTKASTPTGIASSAFALKNKMTAMRSRVATEQDVRLHAMRTGDASVDPVEESEEATLPHKLLTVDQVQSSWKMEAARWCGVALTAFWLGYCLFSFLKGGYGTDIAAPHVLGGLLAGCLAPVALYWMVLAYVQRGADVERYATALRGELQSIIFPSEERSRRINKDIEELCRQAAELSTSSKAVLKSIHRARQGLRSEMRDFAGVSKKTEFHIDRLAETLHERAGRLLTLTDEIEKRTDGIGESSQAGVQAWDEAATKILARADEMEQSLVRGADKILSAADLAGEKTRGIESVLESSYDNLGAAVERAAERLETLSQGFRDHTITLTDATDHVTRETSRLGEQIRQQVENLENLTVSSVAAITRSSDVMQVQNEALDRGTKAVAEQASRITTTIRDSIAALTDTVQTVSETAEEIENRIIDKAGNLSETVKNLSSQADLIEQAGAGAAHKLGEALSVAVSGSESITNAVRRAMELLERETALARAQAEVLTESTGDVISRLQDAGSENLRDIRDVVAVLEQSRSLIETASQLTGSQMETLTAAVEQQTARINAATANLSDRLDNVKTALELPLKDVSAVVADADERHQQIEATLRRRVADLSEASDKAIETAETIRTTLRGQAQEISTLSGQISGHARTINEQMLTQKNELGTGVREALASVEDVRKALENQAGELSRLSGKAVTEMVELKNKIAERVQEASQMSERTVTDLTRVHDLLDLDNRSILAATEKSTKAIEGAAEKLRQAALDVEPVYKRALDQTEEATGRFEALRTGFDDTAESSLYKLQKIGVVFDERLNGLRTGSAEAAEILTSSGEQLQVRVDQIQEAAKSASLKMRDLSAALEDQTSDVHLLTDQALLKIENIQKSINEQFHELTSSIGQAVNQLGDAGASFSKTAEQVGATAIEITDSFDAASLKAKTESAKLCESAALTVTTGETLVRKVQEEAARLLSAAQENLMELRKTGDSYNIRAREVLEQMRVSVKTSQDYTRVLREQATVVADASAESAERISKATAALTVNVDLVSQTADSVSDKVNRAGERLSEESSRMISVSAKAIETAEDAAASFSRQTNALFKAAQQATEQAKDIRQTEWKMQRDAFMGSAKFVLESLHSLSVDLTRQTENEVPEKTWKSFQRGDIAAFTRRLAALSDRIPMDKAREKFANDSEFRTYVQRFLRQFEEVFEQAVANDHGDLLGATFLTSDVGRLYAMLCAVAGKEPKTVNETAKAAA